MNDNHYPEPELKLGCRAINQYEFEARESIAVGFGLSPDVESTPFLDVLKNRRSGRQFCPAKLTDFGAVFYHGSSRQSSYKDPWGARFERRNYASGGGLHSLHSFITELAGKDWYVYNAQHNSFDLVAVESAQIAAFKTTCSQLLQSTQNAWLIWYVSDYDRFCSRYSDADTVLFREAGHLSATHSLIAEYLDLSYCPLGFHGHKEAADLSTERRFIGVGSALIAKRG